MNILILDDDQDRHIGFNTALIPQGHKLTSVYTAKECIEKLTNNTYDMVLLDHDLGGEVYVDSGLNTGWEVAKWLYDNPDKKPERVIIHSYNPVGAHNMKNLIEGSITVPYYLLLRDIHKYTL